MLCQYLLPHIPSNSVSVSHSLMHLCFIRVSILCLKWLHGVLRIPIITYIKNGKCSLMSLYSSTLAVYIYIYIYIYIYTHTYLVYYCCRMRSYSNRCYCRIWTRTVHSIDELFRHFMFYWIKRSILYYWLNFFLLLRNRAIRVFIQTHILALQSSSLFQQFRIVFPVGKPNYYDWFILLVSPWEPVVGLNVNSVQLNPLCVEERRYLLLHI